MTSQGRHGPLSSVPAWVTSETGQTIVARARLNTGASSTVSWLMLTDGSVLVLREIIDRAWLAREPDLIWREAIALSLLHGSEVPVPRLVAAAPDRGLLLAPWIDGRVVTDAAGLRARVGALAATTTAIAATELPSDVGLPPWRSWARPDLPIPDGADRVLWTARHAVLGFALVH